jgi:DNA-binding NarL/FixJ family response regulator
VTRTASSSALRVEVRLVDQASRSRVENCLSRYPPDTAPELVGRRGSPGGCRTVSVVGPDAFADEPAEAALRPAQSATVVFFDRADDVRLIRAIAAGARGFVLASDPPDDLIRAIEAVALGRAWIAPALAGGVLERVGSLALGLITVSTGRLTRREAETAALVVVGMSNAEIAATHQVSESAVKFHVSSLLRKLGCTRRAQLAGVLAQRCRRCEVGADPRRTTRDIRRHA